MRRARACCWSVTAPRAAAWNANIPGTFMPACATARTWQGTMLRPTCSTDTGSETHGAAMRWKRFVAADRWWHHMAAAAELIRHGHNGMLAEPGANAAYVRAVLDLIDRPEGADGVQRRRLKRHRVRLGAHPRPHGSHAARGNPAPAGTRREWAGLSFPAGLASP